MECGERRVLFALCLPAYAQPSPQVVDQINFPKTVDLSVSSWTDAFTTLNKVLKRNTHSLTGGASTGRGFTTNTLRVSQTLSGATISMHFGKSSANNFRLAGHSLRGLRFAKVPSCRAHL